MKVGCCLLLLTFSAHAGVIEDINIEVNHTRTYGKYHKRLDQSVYLHKGDVGACGDFAFTKQAELAKHGISSVLGACYLQNGSPHAFLIAIDPATRQRVVLDNRSDKILRFAEVGCE